MCLWSGCPLLHHYWTLGCFLIFHCFMIDHSARQVKIFNMNRSKISKHYKKAAKSVRIFEASLKKDPHPNEILATEHQANPSTSNAIPTYQDLGSETNTSSSFELLHDNSYVFSSDSSSHSSSSDSIHIEPELFDVPVVEPRVIEPNENDVMLSIDSSDGGTAASITLCSQLSEWAVKHNITHTAVNDLLLNILKPNFPELPIDARNIVANAS